MTLYDLNIIHEMTTSILPVYATNHLSNLITDLSITVVYYEHLATTINKPYTNKPYVVQTQREQCNCI